MKTISDVQISAYVSGQTKELLDRVSRYSGLKKGRLIEDAVRVYLLHLLATPPQHTIAHSLTISDAVMRELAERFDAPPPATADLKRFLKKHGKGVASAAEAAGLRKPTRRR